MHSCSGGAGRIARAKRALLLVLVWLQDAATIIAALAYGQAGQPK
jgi:hypothetical protein